jgi:hypothetical protein
MFDSSRTIRCPTIRCPTPDHTRCYSLEGYPGMGRIAYTTIRTGEADVADDALGGGINTRSNSKFRDVQRGHIRFDLKASRNYSQEAIRFRDVQRGHVRSKTSRNYSQRAIRESRNLPTKGQRLDIWSHAGGREPGGRVRDQSR